MAAAPDAGASGAHRLLQALTGDALIVLCLALVERHPFDEPKVRFHCRPRGFGIAPALRC
jgi:hypothetical protein